MIIFTLAQLLMHDTLEKHLVLCYPEMHDFSTLTRELYNFHKGRFFFGIITFSECTLLVGSKFLDKFFILFRSMNLNPDVFVATVFTFTVFHKLRQLNCPLLCL